MALGLRSPRTKSSKASSSNSPAALPASCVRWIDPLLIAILAAGSYMFCRDKAWSNVQVSLAVSLAVAVPMCALEMLRAPWRRLKRPDVTLGAAARRASVKWVGTMLGFLCALAAWEAMPEYRLASYHPFFDAMSGVLPAVPFVCALWILFTEWRLGPAEDATWHLGLVVLGRWKRIDRGKVRDALLAWLVRGIFLPLNFCALASFIGGFRGSEGDLLLGSWARQEYTLTLMISALLAAAITPGFLFSSRLTGTEIRKVDHSWFGWCVTMACYPPFVTAVFGQWFNFYTTRTSIAWLRPWAEELETLPHVLYAVGGVILLLEIIHYWGEAAFGLRASNLSDRGIITNGPFRFCKHPVYLSKCIGWLLIWVPFMRGDTDWDSLRLTVLWGGICGIYLMRAWVEERLLSSNPAYVAYALWMDEHGALAWTGKIAPFMKYRWRLQRWTKSGDVTPQHS